MGTEVFYTRKRPAAAYFAAYSPRSFLHLLHQGGDPFLRDGRHPRAGDGVRALTRPVIPAQERHADASFNLAARPLPGNAKPLSRLSIPFSGVQKSLVRFSIV